MGLRAAKYRVRWGIVNGAGDRREKRCLAERRVSFLGLPFWWPLSNGGWRTGFSQAEADIDADIQLRKPLSTTYFHNKGDL